MTSSTDSVKEKRTLTKVIIGRARDVRDPHIFENLSLVAFLAWVGLGSDGLSSSCYGPEEAFRALGSHRYLAIGLAALTAVTVLLISAAYRRVRRCSSPRLNSFGSTLTPPLAPP